MKVLPKILLTFFLISFFTFNIFAVNPVFSESAEKEEFDRIYKEYQGSQEEYKAAYDAYILARAQYLKFKTLASENNAIEKTRKMLSSRNEVLRKYLLTLKAKVFSQEGIGSATKELLSTRIDAEVVWYENHSQKLSSAATLNDLIADSNAAMAHYESMNSLIYEVLSKVVRGRVNDFEKRLTQDFAKISDKIIKIKEEERADFKFSAEKIQIIERWIFETQGRVERSQGKIAEADSLIALMEVGINKKKGYEVDYEQVLARLSEAQQYLKEASSFLKEIVRQVKTAD